MEQYQTTLMSLVLWLVFGQALAKATYHTCIHDKVAVDNIPTIQLRGPPQLNATVQADFRNIRISLQTTPGLDSRLAGLVTSPSGALTRAIQTISATLLVRPIQGNYTVPYPCTQWTSGPNKGKCMPSRAASQAMCGPLAIPAQFVGGKDICASPNATVCNRTQQDGYGAVDTDFLLFVGSVNDSACRTAPLVLSFAAPCAKDSWYRPAAGYINLCASNLLQRPTALLYDLMLHELIHALGFSARRFQDFHDGNLSFYQPNVSVSYSKQSITALNSPKVLAVGRSYFKCQGLAFVPLENNGASRSHWESRVLNHETMTAFLPDDYTSLTNFTLAFFEDSGWYQVNYTYASSISQLAIKWGEGQGCAFVTDSCNSTRTYPYLCNVVGSQDCTFDHGAKGECNIYTFFDGCPIVLAGPNSTCLPQPLTTGSSICVEVNTSARNCMPNSGTPGCYVRKVLVEAGTGMIAYNVSVNGSEVVCRDSQVVLSDRGFVLCPSQAAVLLRASPLVTVNALPASHNVVVPSNSIASINGTDYIPLPVCGYPITCTQYGALNIVGGPTPYEGQLQICLNGKWNTICSSGFSDEAAEVACRQMGFGSTGATVLPYYYLPQSSAHPIAYKYTSCSGSENSLLDCSHTCLPYDYLCLYYSSCYHSTDVGVECQRPCNDNDTRIIQGDSISSTGVVQVCKNKVWGDLCAPTWGYKEASVVCKQNSYSRYGAIPGRASLSSVAVPVPNYTAVLNCTDKDVNLSGCTNGGGFTQSPDCNSGASWVNCFTSANVPPASCQDGAVRLRNGYLDSEGRVEVCINNAWGTVCGLGLSLATASVVCRQLGYYPVAKGYFSYGTGTGPVLLGYLNCNGFESSLLECSGPGVGVVTSSCSSHYWDTGVGCQTIPAPDNCTLGDIRLVGGNGSSGEVQFCYGNLWGSVCYSGWDNRDAGVVCKQLGYNFGGRGLRSNVSISSRVIAVMKMDCTGVENSTAQCPQSGTSCSSGAAAAVICNGPDPTNITCTDGDIQLRNGASMNEGRVEVCYDDQWAPVCDPGWNSQKATVTCRQLGLVPYGSTAYPNAFYGVGTRPPVMQVFSCSGNEQSLTSCSHTPLGSTPSCSPTNEVGVSCLVRGNSCIDGTTRIVNGNTNFTGRVEVCNYGLWGTVCDSNWNTIAAAIACVQSGLPNGLGAIPRFNQMYGRASGPIWLSQLSCVGDETSLFNCTYTSLSTSCTHYNDAGVECPTPEPLSNCTNGALRLMYGTTSLDGRLEICQGGLWGTVCAGHYSVQDLAYSFSDTWTTANANIACKQLGYAPIGASFRVGINPTQDTRGILLSDVSCSGTESSLLNCTHNPIGYHQCDHNHDVTIKCQAPCTEPCRNGAVRLAGGSSNLTNGRVEMCNIGCWVPVCGDYGWNQGTAAITCKQLGLTTKGSGLLGAGSFIPSNWTAYISLYCSGQEQSLSSCYYYLISSCYYGQAGAQCTAGQSTVASPSPSVSRKGTTQVVSSTPLSSTPLSSTPLSSTPPSAAVSSTIVSAFLHVSAISSVQSSMAVLSTTPRSAPISPSGSTPSVQSSTLAPPTTQGDSEQADIQSMAQRIGISVGVVCVILLIVLVVLICVLALVIIRRKSAAVLSKKDLQHGDKEELKLEESTIEIKESIN